MSEQNASVRLLEHVADLLDIPRSYYEKAKKRYESIGDWLHREASSVARLDPTVFPQGSFRYGTVIRPLLKGEEYDLDLVCHLILTKACISQADLKKLVGDEVKAYATAHCIKAPVEEKRRCWRLDYADDVTFHMDILPAIPDDEGIRSNLIRARVPAELVQYAVAISDWDHPHYRQICPDWFSSNPKGFALWFERRMRTAAEARLRQLVEARVYASVEDVPPYDWKTPLQRSIQILKRHRDVMFNSKPDLKPISMIITTLSARAYEGELNLFDAITNILDAMPQYVAATVPRVPNPVDPAEDFADKWSEDPRLEKNFRLWHAQAKADITRIPGFQDQESLRKHIRSCFGVDLDASIVSDLFGPTGRADIRVVTPALEVIRSKPRPWGVNG